MLSLPLTPKSPYSGRGQAGVPLTARCSCAELEGEVGEAANTGCEGTAPNQAGLLVAQSVIWELTPQLPSAGE